MPAILADELVKRFDDVLALDGVSAGIERGELFGFIGPDGAGKTTLFRVLTGLLVPDGGSASVLGFDVIDEYRHVRRRVGYMPGRFSLYDDLSVRENLDFFASVYGSEAEGRADFIAPAYRQLEPFEDRRAANLSGGMKQKLALSCALVHRPDVLLLDEPTTGVDAVSRREFWDLLTDLRTRGLTVVVSTPYMDEANRCDRVALIDRGSILRVDAPDAIGADYDRPLLAVRGDERYPLLRTLRDHPHAAAVYPFGDEIHFTDDRAEADPTELAVSLSGWLEARAFEGVRVGPIAADIEDTFMALMGSSSRTFDSRDDPRG